MIGFYIIFGLLCILLGFAIVSWFIVYKEIRNKIDNYSDYNDFIEFNNCLLNISKVQSITKYKNNISLVIDGDLVYTEKFNSEEKCNNRYLDILDCISYYPKSY